MAIKSFSHKGLETLFCTGKSAAIGADYRKKAKMLLDALDGATSVNDVAPIGGYHPLAGDRKGTFAVKVNQNWRLTFKFDDGDKGNVTDVDLEDYH
jgi:proteic killer suppression protein